MLRRMLYLDAAALAQYVSALEGGLLTTSNDRIKRVGTGGGGFDAKVLHVEGEKSREEEKLRTFSDTDEARFDRLLRAAESEPEKLGWVEIIDSNSDFNEIGYGAMVAWECDIHIPQIIQMLGKSGEARQALELMQTMMPMAQQLGLNTEGLPDVESMGAMAGFLGAMNANLVVVGEDDDSDWTVAGPLTAEHVFGDVEGRARIVGKVSKIIPTGSWKPYVTFPGMNLLSREERRKLARERPPAGKEDEYLAGPALMVDILAIYR